MSDLFIRLSNARTFLFVPGDRPERFAKACAAGADAVVFDLEDAVAPEKKGQAREFVAEWLRHSPGVVVRINSCETEWHDRDVEMVSEFECAVMLPKAEKPWKCGSKPIIPLIETARGVLNADSVCASNTVVRAALGTVDLAAQLGIAPDDHQALLAARSALVLASAATGIAPPIDGVTTALTDQTVLVNDVVYSRRIGLTAKLCIHPAQVVPSHKALAPSAEDLAWAHRVLAAIGSDGVAAVDGKMVDKPVVERARQIVGWAARL